MIGAILQGITSNLPQITATIVSMMQTWISNIATFYPMLLQAGLQILMSLIQGITVNLPFLVQAVITLIQSLSYFYCCIFTYVSTRSNSFTSRIGTGNC